MSEQNWLNLAALRGQTNSERARILRMAAHALYMLPDTRRLANRTLQSTGDDDLDEWLRHHTNDSLRGNPYNLGRARTILLWQQAKWVVGEKFRKILDRRHSAMIDEAATWRELERLCRDIEVDEE